MKAISEKYEALYISDIHLSNKLPYAKITEGGVTDRLDEQRQLFVHVRTVLDTKPQIRDIYILGDLFDKAIVDPITMTRACSYIKLLLGHDDIDVYILPGNHDSNSVKGGRFITEAFGAIGHDRLHSLSEPGYMHKGEKNWLTFFYLPYCSKEKAEKQLKDFSALIKDTKSSDPDKKFVLLMHHSINGCVHDGWTCDDGLEADSFVEDYDFVLSGHFHEHQFFGSNLEGMYLGSPMHHRFDDAGREATYWTIEFRSDGNHQLEKHDPGLAKFWILNNLKEHVPVDASHKNQDFVRWRIKATHEDWKKLKTKVEEKVLVANSFGFRSDFLYRPVTVSRGRLSDEEVSSDTPKPKSLDEQISLYVNRLVEKEETKKIANLKSVGLEILKEARLAR